MSNEIEQSSKQKSCEQPKARSGEASKNQKTIPPQEIGGRGGLEPVRFGDWEIAGKCVDF